MDKHKIREFDSIADGHEQALIAMGVIDKKKRAARRGGPECPPLFISTFETYCDIKFTRHVREDAVVLFARESVTWQDLKAYLDVTQKQLSLFEIDVIMGLEAIFEGRNHV